MASEINGKEDEIEKSNNPTINNPINFRYPNPYSLSYPPMLSSGYPLGNPMINYPFSYPYVPYLGGNIPTLPQANNFGQGRTVASVPFSQSINYGQEGSVANMSLPEFNSNHQENALESDGMLSPQDNNNGRESSMGYYRMTSSEDNSNSRESDIRSYRSRQRNRQYSRSRSRERNRSRERSRSRERNKSRSRNRSYSPQCYRSPEHNRYGMSYGSNHDNYRQNLSSYSSQDIDDRYCLSSNDNRQNNNSSKRNPTTYVKMKNYVNARGCKDRTIHLKLRYCTEAELRNHLSQLIIRTQIEIKRIWTDDHLERYDIIAPIAMIILDSKESVSEMLRIIESGSKKLIVKATEFDWNHNIRSLNK